MATYAKLWSFIVSSSLWGEAEATRIVFLTMLALSDLDGHVDGSVVGLARIANVPLEGCQIALERLSSPDPHSRTPDNEGRRILAEDGGWRILNYGKHRDGASQAIRNEQTKVRMRKYRERKRNGYAQPTVTQSNADALQVTPGDESAPPTDKPKLGRPPNPELFVFPAGLDTSEFREVFKRFAKHRTEMKKPLRKTSGDSLLARLDKVGIDKATLAVENSIANGWQGVFEPKGDELGASGGSAGGLFADKLPAPDLRTDKQRAVDRLLEERLNQ